MGAHEKAYTTMYVPLLWFVMSLNSLNSINGDRNVKETHKIITGTRQEIFESWRNYNMTW